LGCLKLTYQTESVLKIVSSKNELTSKKSATNLRSAYLYGFMNYEKDDEVKGSGNHLDFGARCYDPRLGRFLSIDPLASTYPYQSPYVFADNNPIMFIDQNGEGANDPRLEFYKKMMTASIRAVRSMTIQKEVTVRSLNPDMPDMTTVVMSQNNANKFKALYMVAQRRMENGFNGSPPGNNPFNIKGSGNAGQVSYQTHEFENGKKINKKASFAKFTSLEKGIKGYMDLLQRNFKDAYDVLADDTKTVEDFAHGLQNGRLGAYATSPTYKEKFKTMLTGVVNDVEEYYVETITETRNLINDYNKAIEGGQMTDSALKATVEKRDELMETLGDLNNDLIELRGFKKNEGIE